MCLLVVGPAAVVGVAVEVLVAAIEGEPAVFVVVATVDIVIGFV